MAHQHQHHKNGHAHDHGTDGDTGIDWAAMSQHLESQAELYAPWYERALAWLGKEITEPGLIVDVGSGPGVVTGLFAETFPGARVIAADGSQPLLDRARERAERLGYADRFATLVGELPGSLAELDYPADLVWAGRSLHHLGDQRAALAACAQRLAPGGTLALMEGGLSPRYLPRDLGFGRPGLESRIEALSADWFARMRADLPGAVAEREDWAALLASAGLQHTRARSFLLDLPAPASDRARAYVVEQFTRVRDGIGEHLDAQDRETVDRLLDPQDPGSIQRRPDLYVLAAHTVHTAVRPA
ncbi:methyltransferase domain-containing protein [Streptomyces niveiscabiei]|uniref:class I SAM-dependent methyltransferase n=1 Tax=Streptomyces niveiscabiei TaxID=164115 RepID=UPI0029AEC5F0|nr:methyltransferase [Streptomyces niveiscabiei]MDX3380885.1 methyltransferase domain-containing protein [Streptomyces niveiscabiei]